MAEQKLSKDTLHELPRIGYVMAWSDPAQTWKKLNVKWVRAWPQIYTKWKPYERPED